jgi:hypothetical protein
MEKLIVIQRIDKRIEELRELQYQLEFNNKDIEFTITLHRKAELEDLRNWLLIEA